jgi:TonB dependent receptor/TonB-dependent Receptor Plug Domain
MNYTRTLMFLILLFCENALLQASYCLKGRVIDGVTKKEVSFSVIQIIEPSNWYTCDSSGYFQLCEISKNSYSLKISHTAYLSKVIQIHPKEGDFLLIELDKNIITTKEVVINGSQERRYNAAIAGSDLLTKKDIQKLPAFLGETDVIKSVQLLPGVQSVSEGNSGVYVRGGSAGQNLFTLDEMELMNPSHLMGIYSVFNPQTTDKVEVYKGNAPVNMQGRLSSTIAVQSIQPTKENAGFEVNIGNISTNISYTGVSKNEKLGITIGYRQCYLNGLGWVSSLFLPDDKNYFKKYNYGFYDFNGKINAQISKKSLITASWYLGKDDFSINNEDLKYNASTGWGNQSAIILLKHTTESGDIFKYSINYSTTFSDFDGEIIESNMLFKSKFTQWKQKNEWVHSWNNHLIHAGIDVFYQYTAPIKMTFSYVSDTLIKSSFNNAGLAFYVGDYWHFSEKAELYAGLRTSINSALGPYAYGQKSYSKNEVVKTYLSWSPIVSLSLFPKDGQSLKMSYALNNQDLHLASLSSIPLPNDIWASSSPRVKPETSHQLSIGYYRIYNDYSFSVEAYGKYMTNQLIFNAITDNTSSLGFEDQFFKGKGIAFGIDFSLSKKTGPITGTIKYSYSRSKRSFHQIYDGAWFNDKYDRPHDLNLSLFYQRNTKWSFSALWVFASGNNLTLPSGRWWMMGSIMNDYDGYNNFRLPYYHRLDFSASYKLKVKRLKESVLNFSIINVYNRANPYFAFYKVYMKNNQNNIDIKSMQTSLFPIMPSVGWRFKF